MRLTDHAIMRGRERLGLGKTALGNTAERVLLNGLGRSQCKGALRLYFDRKRADHPDGELFLYGKQVFVFAGNVLLTCWNLPPEMEGLALPQWREWCGKPAVKRAREAMQEEMP